MIWPEMSEPTTDIDLKRGDFGQTLKLAREQAGLSIECVAEQLNLPEKAVEAIENSDMARLPPAAFVRGYIRVYAKIVDYDVEKLLHDFDSSVPHAHETELHPLSSLPLEASSQTPLVRLVTVMIALIAVLVMIYGAFSYYSQKSEDMEQAAETDNGQLQFPPEAPFGAEHDVGVVDAGLGTASIVEEAAPAEEPVSTDTITENQVQTLTTELPIEAQSPHLEPVEQPVATAEPAVEPAMKEDVLVLESSAESWAEIKDASGERKFYGLLGEGRARTLNGLAPFDVFLGNAPAVRLTLNDIKVDMTKHTRSNKIAHFKVTTKDGRARIY